eukprot:m.359113 g.359113  ORF g.359113 m.359113 type:complete len:562 (-) comp18418_c0_seq1:460-2145(-)
MMSSQSYSFSTTGDASTMLREADGRNRRLQQQLDEEIKRNQSLVMELSRAERLKVMHAADETRLDARLAIGEESSKQQLLRAQQEIERLKLQVADEQEEGRLLKNERDRMEASRNELQLLLNEIQSGSGDSTFARARAAAASDRFARDNTAFLQGELAHLQSELREVTISRQELQVRHESTEMELMTLKEELAAVTKERDGLYDIVDKLSKHQHTIHQDKLDITVISLEQEVQRLQQAILQKDIELMQVRSTSHSSMIGEHERRELMTELAALKQDADEAKQQHSEAQEELARLGVRAAERQHALSKELDELKAIIAGNATEYEALLAKYKEQAHQLQSTLSSVRQTEMREMYSHNTSGQGAMQQPMQRDYTSSLKQSRRHSLIMHGGQTSPAYGLIPAIRNNTIHAMTTQPMMVPQQVNTMQHVQSVPSAQTVRHAETALRGWDQINYPQPVSASDDIYYFPGFVLNYGLGQDFSGFMWLRVSPTHFSLVDRDTEQPLLEVQLNQIRRFGHDYNVFSLEFGRSAPTGQGDLFCATLYMAEIFAVMKDFTGTDERFFQVDE